MTGPARGPSETVGRQWKKLMDERDPLHSRNYCVHGQYVGSNDIFAGNCSFCMAERAGFEPAQPDG